MALIACHECGNQVSTKSPTCPSCGAPVKSVINRTKSVGRWIWYAASALVIVVVFRACYQVGDVISRSPIAGG
jgi:predicted amidophosphoribosyltransferase